MKSAVHEILPLRVRRSLSKLGRDIAIARKKRRLTVAMMSERTGVARSTYLRVERGDATVSFGAYAMALFVLGASDALGEILDASRDDQGLLLDLARLPKRVRAPRGAP